MTRVLQLETLLAKILRNDERAPHTDGRALVKHDYQQPAITIQGNSPGFLIREETHRAMMVRSPGTQAEAARYPKNWSRSDMSCVSPRCLH